MVYKKERTISLKGSVSSLFNNLSVMSKPDRNFTCFAVTHKASAHLVYTSADSVINHHTLTANKEGGTSPFLTTVLQSKWCFVGNGRSVLVLTSQHGIQMFEGDGNILLYWHSLVDKETQAETPCAVFARGVCAVGTSTICVGTAAGDILSFQVPQHGGSVQQTAMLHGHGAPITDLTANNHQMASADEFGVILLWTVGEGDTLRQSLTVNGQSEPCTSVRLWKGVLVGAFVSGVIRLYNRETGIISVEIAAHGRSINAIDIAPTTGYMISASDDSFINVWKIGSEDNNITVGHVQCEEVADTQLCGACFLDAEGTQFSVSGYDSCDIVCFKRS